MEDEACKSACFLRLSNFAPVGIYARRFRHLPANIADISYSMD